MLLYAHYFILLSYCRQVLYYNIVMYSYSPYRDTYTAHCSYNLLFANRHNVRFIIIIIIMND